MYFKKLNALLLLYATLLIPYASGVRMTMLTYSEKHPGHGRIDAYMACSNLSAASCCHGLGNTFDMGSFDGLPENAMSTYWTWNGSPHLPAESSAACSEKMQICDRTTPFSSYTAPIPRSSTSKATRSIITGGKWLDIPNGSAANKLSASTTNDLPDVVLMCTNSSTSGDQVDAISRVDRKRADADVASDDEPPAWVYPDIIMYRGTEYTDDQRNDKVYKDSAGNIFDLNLLNA